MFSKAFLPSKGISVKTQTSENFQVDYKQKILFCSVLVVLVFEHRGT